MEQIKVERSIWIDTPREQVWQAIADPADLAMWLLDNVQKKYECLKKLGVTFTQKPLSKGGWTTAVFDDTNGNRIEISEIKEAAK